MIHIKGVHSTQMVADRAVTHFKETPADQPIFAMLSIYDLHSPNGLQPQDQSDPRCASMPPWDPPNYNEADVSDKPAVIQTLPVQPYADGWPMVTYCQEMLGVDRAVGQVIGELPAENRLDNTLLMFTADNGMTWGQHRLGQQKSWPYATPAALRPLARRTLGRHAANHHRDHVGHRLRARRCASSPGRHACLARTTAAVPGPMA